MAPNHVQFYGHTLFSFLSKLYEVGQTSNNALKQSVRFTAPLVTKLIVPQ